MLTKPLYPYQIPPVSRFLERGNLLVAFEMGLGKTPIAIACAEELLGCRDITTALVVCPASLKYQWGQKIAEFTDLPSVPYRVKDQSVIIPRPESCTIIDGPPKMRQLQYRSLLSRRPEYVIMSYENVLNDGRFVRRISPGLVILDECTAIKSFAAKRTKRIKLMLNAEYRLGLTGTPVENRPEELFSIMQWVDESALGRYDLFDRAYIRRDRYGRVTSYRNLPVLRKRIAPAVSRKSRLDPEVAAYLPSVDAGEWYVPVPPALLAVYRDIAVDLYMELKGLSASGSFDLASYYAGGQVFADNTALGRVMARQMALEMALDHPDLLVKSAADYEDSRARRDKGEIRADWPGSKYAAQKVTDGLPVYPTPKLDLLRDKVSGILGFDRRNKILVFSRFVGMLDIMRRAFPQVGSVTFHGGMSVKDKAAAIARFGSDPDCRLFLSSHAGAYGNDMFMANYLINYDLPWSAGRADQINGRHVRASSQFSSVFIRNIIMSGTVEERRLALLAFKRKIGGAILDGRGDDKDGAIENDLQSLLSHLTGVLSL